MYQNSERNPDNRNRPLNEEEYDEYYEEERANRRRHKIPWFWLILLFIVIFLVTSYLTGWTNSWSKGLNAAFPNLNFDWLNNPTVVETTEVPPAVASVDPPAPTAAITVAPDPTAPPPPTAPPTEEPTAPPTAPPATPTPVVTAAPVAHGTFTMNGEIHLKVNGEDVVLRKFIYSGGYIPADDPYFSTQEKETNESYGPPIYGQTPQELTYNWLRELCKSPHQVIRLRVQMGMISPKSLHEEDLLAFELAAKSPADYDRIVNETLEFFFKQLDGGRIESSVDWNLENYMKAAEGPDDSWEINLHGRTNGDDDTDPEHKDVLLTFYAKGAKKTFVSSARGFYNTVNDAGESKGSFSQRAWVNMTEGGTWKWKSKGGGGNPPPPTSTPPGNTATPVPTSTPRPTKDPSERPTESDAPIGGGGTNPQNSEDPHTTSAPTSTPAPEVTSTPIPTSTPTAVPTAEVRPTEVCTTSAAPPIREDENTPPPGGQHNVPTQEPGTGGGNNTGDFDPGSI